MDASSDFSKSITKSIILHYRTYSYSHDTARAITETANRASVHGTDERTACTTKILCPAQYARQRILHHRTAVQGNRPQGRHQPPRIQTRLTDHKYAATPVPQSPRSRSLALLRGPAMRTRSMPLRSMPTPRLTERRTYLRPFSPRAVVDEIMHISTFFTKPVARLWTFHLPSAHGKFWPQHIFRTGAGTRSGGKTAS